MTPEERAEHDLASLRRWMARLRTFDAAWDSPDFDEREREAFPFEWDNAVGRLARVEATARRGTLRPSVVVELRDVARELDALRPMLERLHLRMPDPDALARALAASAV